jgi:hypothetical protein
MLNKSALFYKMWKIFDRNAGILLEILIKQPGIGPKNFSIKDAKNFRLRALKVMRLAVPSQSNLPFVGGVVGSDSFVYRCIKLLVIITPLSLFLYFGCCFCARN